MAVTDTIAAIATAPGRGGIGVVRVSGPRVAEIAAAVLKELPTPRQATLRYFADEKGNPLDQGIALYFPAPHSFTGEDVLELQGHGGTAVLQLVLNRCLVLGARLAEPGEFTRRAFLNEKLDLAQAESVVDLIDAASVEAAKSAMRSLNGEFSTQVNSLVEQLVDLRMLVEATLDFPDEEIDFLEAAHARERLVGICAQLGQVKATARQGSLLREGMHVVLVGQPNVGKSSLLNRLAGEEVSIVTEVAGTTRDAIRQHIQIEGVPLHIIDTAGLRETEDQVEQIGISRTWAMVEKADLAVLLMDVRQGLTEADETIVTRLPPGMRVVRVFNKIDTLPNEIVSKDYFPDADVYLSAKTGAGIGRLKEELLRAIGWQPAGEGIYMARERHLHALNEAEHHLAQAGAAWAQLEFLAEELALAQKSLSAITGAFTADDLLGEIFSRFCIGK